MCNIAGYVGTKTAASILLEMMKREEGFAGGYYTGLATIHEGKLYWRKVIGTVKDLLEQTDAASLPGTIGIIHSRSKSGGDAEWGHPFVDPAESFAYVANGTVGRFQNTPALSEAAAKLYADGWRFRSSNPDLPHYPACAPGQHVHVSEVMCFLIDACKRRGLNPGEAMADVFCNYPAEIVGLTVDTACPDRINAARINMPMMVGSADDGTYLASTAMAFPEGVTFQNIYPIPVNSSAEVFAGHVNIIPFTHPATPVAELLPMEKAFNAVRIRLSEGPAKLGELIRVVKPLFGDIVCPADHLTYEVLRTLKQEGIVFFTEKETEGAAPGVIQHTFTANLA